MKKLTKIAVSFLPLLGLVLVAPVFAQDTINLAPPSGWEGLNFTIPALVSGLIKLILVIAALIAFFFLILGGIKWITAGGDKANTETARNTLTAALIGLLIVFGAWAIIRLIETFFGITILQLEIPSI
ncbi:hypothetical protein KKF11_01590 [Patescibacteria group bacterium]|nr:hypothetical protein [Patescibacteria group bacterium]